MFRPIIEENAYKVDTDYIAKAIEMVKERVSFISELWDQSYFFFEPPKEYDKKLTKKKWKAESPALMTELKEIFISMDNFTATEIENEIKNFLEMKELGMGQIMNAFRLCIVGSNKGPGMFDIAELLGKKEVTDRIDAAVIKLGSS